MKLQARFSLHRIKNIILLPSGLFLKACARSSLNALYADGNGKKLFVGIFADLPTAREKGLAPPVRRPAKSDFQSSLPRRKSGVQSRTSANASKL